MHDQIRERRLQCLAPVVLSSGRGPIVRRPGRDSPSRTDHRVGNWGSVKGHFLDLPGLNSGSIPTEHGYRGSVECGRSTDIAIALVAGRAWLLSISRFRTPQSECVPALERHLGSIRSCTVGRERRTLRCPSAPASRTSSRRKSRTVEQPVARRVDQTTCQTPAGASHRTCGTLVTEILIRRSPGAHLTGFWVRR